MYSKAELTKALKCKGRPLIGGEAGEFLRSQRGGYIECELASIRGRAEQYLSEPIPELSYKLFSLYWENGDRERYQRPYFSRRGRLLTVSVMCFLEKENPLWREALAETLWAICQEPYWCLPAHFTGHDEQPLPLSEYSENIDLFSAETGFAICEAVELCKEQLPQQLVSLALELVTKRILEPFLSPDRVYRFETMENNWSAVCAAAIGGAALYCIEDVWRLSNILMKCLECFNVYLSSFGEDGICTEGVDYYSYGFGFFAVFADLLKKRTEGAIDLFAIKKVDAIARSQQHFYISGKSTLSFSDGSSSSHFRMGLSCKLQSIYPGLLLPGERSAAGVLEDSCYRYCLGIRDLLWYNSGTKFGAPAESTWLPGAKWFLSAGKSLCVAAKGGTNFESHNHNDCGSFIVYKNGEELIADFGAGLYDAAYFSARRYEIFVNRSKSHNLPLIDGCEQCAGESYFAKDESAELGDGINSFSLDLSGCYSVPALKSFKRRIVHDTALDTITVSDSFTGLTDTNITEVFVSKNEIVLSDGCATFKSGGESISLLFSEGGFRAEVVTESYTGHHSQQQTAFRLLLHKRVSGDETLKFLVK